MFEKNTDIGIGIILLPWLLSCGIGEKSLLPQEENIDIKTEIQDQFGVGVT